MLEPIGGMDDTATKVMKHLDVMQRRFRERDSRWEDVRALRRGEWDHYGDIVVSEAFPKPIVQNFVDTTARDLAEMLAPLPSFNCSSVSMRSDAERKRADLRTKIATNYVSNSRLGRQMLYGGDHYFTYGMTVFYVEPDFDEKLPRIVVEDPHGGYPEFDRWDRLRSYTKVMWQDPMVLAELYPEYADAILAEARKAFGVDTTAPVRLVRHWDDKGQTLVLGGSHPLVLDYVRNRTRRIPVVVARRPWLDPSEIKGQFDDVVWIQLARNGLAVLQYELTEKLVQSPIAVPNDVTDVSYGPDAVIRSATPEKIRRVGMESSNMAFAESATLTQDMQAGARYPAARMGESDASVITGRGVQALLGGLDAQVRSAQEVLRHAFTDVIQLCFEMDERVWPNSVKDVRGAVDGSPYEITYKPKRDINGSYTCQVEYGFAAGLDANRAIVALLQLRAEKVFSRDYMARNIPFDIDVTEEQSKVAVEDTRDALLQSIYAYVQAIPAMAQSGVDPTDAVQKVSAIVKGLQKGRMVEDVVSEVFAPQQAPVLGGSSGDGSDLGGGPGGPGPGGSAGLNPSGLMTGVPAGQAGEAPGGRPDLSVLMAGLSPGGNPQMSSYVMKRRRA